MYCVAVDISAEDFPGQSSQHIHLNADEKVKNAVKLDGKAFLYQIKIQQNQTKMFFIGSGTEQSG